jgi:hypothetical protein
MRGATRGLITAGIAVLACAVLAGALVNARTSIVHAVPAQSKKKATPPVDQDYVGVHECAECHEKAFESWQKTGHAHAFKVLTAKYEKDPKCLKCHTTGYGTPTGYKDESTPDLKGITCESCHGPGSKHVEICESFGDKELTEAEEDRAKHSIWEMLPKNVCVKCHTRMAHEESETPEELRRHKKGKKKPKKKQ